MVNGYYKSDKSCSSTSMKPRTPHFHFDIISGLKRPNMKKINFTNPKHVDEFIKNHSNDLVHTKNG